MRNKKYNKYISLLVHYILLLISFLPLSIFGQETGIIDYPTINYRSVETIVTVDDIFLNEGLNRPFAVRYLSNSQNIVVMDNGNDCLYIFDNTGNFLRKIGNTGRGPAEFRSPVLLNVSRGGTIYVYDSSLLRISMFSGQGEFLDSFQLYRRIGYQILNYTNGFSISADDNLILNQPSGGFYISEYFPDGQLQREIGKIKVINKDKPDRNIFFAEGFPFKHNNGKYYIFLSELGSVNVYDNNGLLTEEYTLEIPEIKANIQMFVAPDQENQRILRYYFSEVILLNDKFYIMPRMEVNLKVDRNNILEEELIIYELDEDLKILRKFVLGNYRFDRRIARERQFIVMKRFGITDNEDILIANFGRAEIMKFSKNK